ncbi:MAG: hypothetical protein ACC661_12125 [Verrucomicrobiales bacterium]
MDSELVPFYFGGLLVFSILVLIVVIAGRREKMRVVFLEAVSKKLGLTSHDRKKSVIAPAVMNFPLLVEGSSRKILNIMQGEINGLSTTIFDVRHKLGKGKDAVETMQTVLCMQSKDLELPAFMIRPVAAHDDISASLGYHELNIEEEFPAVAAAYRITAKDPDQARGILGEDVVHRFSRMRDLSIEGMGPLVLFYRQDQLRRPEDLGAFMTNGFKVLNEFEDAVFWSGNHAEGADAEGEAQKRSALASARQTQMSPRFPSRTADGDADS